MALSQQKQLLSGFFYHGLQQAHGCEAVYRHLQQNPVKGDIAVVSVGKAASAMMQGAEKALGSQLKTALVITRYGYADKLSKWPVIESAHPVPDESSLYAGKQLIEFLVKIPEDRHLLVLLSGGSSSLVEVPAQGVTLDALQALNRQLLASGLPISEMNRQRQAVSRIKGGKALAFVKSRRLTQLLISDVEADQLQTIGSGPFVSSSSKECGIEVHHHIVASNPLVCETITRHATAAGHEVHYHGQQLYDDVHALAPRLAQELDMAAPGIHIWGGEPTICLPETPGQGGRCQSLALALAQELHLSGQHNVVVLVAATDGMDGQSPDAGAVVDSETIRRGGGLEYARQCLEQANAGVFLAASADLLSTGPTGTNVMDLVIACKLSI